MLFTVCKGDELFNSKAFDVNVVDTTGAGDNFVAGFLDGYINNYSLDKCSKLGNYCAAETIKIREQDLILILMIF